MVEITRYSHLFFTLKGMSIPFRQTSVNWTPEAFIFAGLISHSNTKASNVFATSCYPVWLTWCHWYSRLSIELLWSKDENIYWCLFHINVKCFGLPFSSWEKQTNARSMVTHLVSQLCQLVLIKISYSVNIVFSAATSTEVNAWLYLQKLTFFCWFLLFLWRVRLELNSDVMWTTTLVYFKSLKVVLISNYT